MRRRFEEIFELAKTAAQWNLDADEGYEKFRFFALEQGIKEENLAYYLNAYQAAGESGLKALTYKKPMPEEVRIAATWKMNEYFAARLPQNRHAGKLWFRVVAKDNRITAAERRPYFKDHSRTTTSEFFQVRYTDYDGKWHLYWKRASGKWCPMLRMGLLATIRVFKKTAVTELTLLPPHTEPRTGPMFPTAKSI